MFVGIHGVETREDHGLELLETRQRLDGRMLVVGNRIADLGVGNILDGSAEKAHFTGRQLLHFHRLGSEDPKRFHIERVTIRHQPDALAFVERALDYARQNDHAAIGVKPGIEDERLKLIAGPSFRWRDALYDRLQYLGNAL